MVKADTSALGECLAADHGWDAGLRAGGRRAGTAGPRLAGAVGGCTIRTGERGAL
jgi:hypothetical protein